MSGRVTWTINPVRLPIEALLDTSKYFRSNLRIFFTDGGWIKHAERSGTILVIHFWRFFRIPPGSVHVCKDSKPHQQRFGLTFYVDSSYSAEFNLKAFFLVQYFTIPKNWFELLQIASCTCSSRTNYSDFHLTLKMHEFIPDFVFSLPKVECVSWWFFCLPRCEKCIVQ